MRLRELILKIPKKYLHFKIFNLIKYIVFRKFHIIANKLEYFSLPYLPLTMDVEPTTGCNFRCTMCDVSSPNWITKNMKMETFKKLIDMNKQLLQIKLQGMGEPFVNKNYLEFVDYASNYGIFIQFVTNGSLLDEKLINSLCERKNISLIGVSIDGATKKTFEKLYYKFYKINNIFVNNNYTYKYIFHCLETMSAQDFDKKFISDNLKLNIDINLDIDINQQFGNLL